YLVAYGFTTIAAFAIVPLVRDAAGEATHLSQWRGLGRRSPVMAGSFAFLLFALAGIPLTSGFTGKFAVFQAAMQGHAAGLVIVGVIASAVAAFFYARVAVLMFFTQPAEGGPTVALPGAYTAIVVGLGVAVTLVLGILPGGILSIAHSSWPFVYG
ncbi:MAG: proton-conducting transporter transmembrane domain-containing protein, partial [Mycobacteriales bacterium]